MGVAMQLYHSRLLDEIHGYLKARREGISHHEADRSSAYHGNRPGGDIAYVGDHIGGYSILVMTAALAGAGAAQGQEEAGVAGLIVGGIAGLCVSTSLSMAGGGLVREVVERGIRLRGNCAAARARARREPPVELLV